VVPERLSQDGPRDFREPGLVERRELVRRQRAELHVALPRLRDRSEGHVRWSGHASLVLLEDFAFREKTIEPCGRTAALANVAVSQPLRCVAT